MGLRQREGEDREKARAESQWALVGCDRTLGSVLGGWAPGEKITPAAVWRFATWAVSRLAVIAAVKVTGNGDWQC